MAYNNEERDAIAAAIPNLPAEVLALFNAKPTAETLDVIGALIATQRIAGMTSTVASLVSVTVNNIAQLKAAAAVADGATSIDALRAVKAALDANNEVAFGPAAIAAILALLQHYKDVL